MVIVDLQRAGQVATASLVILEIDFGQTAVIKGQGVLRIQFQAPIQIVQGFLELSHLVQIGRTIQVSVGVFGIDGDGLAAIGHGAFPVFFGTLDKGPADVGLGVARIGLDSPFEIGFGLPPFLHIAVNQPPLPPGLGKIGIGLDRLAQDRQGFLIILFGAQRHAFFHQLARIGRLRQQKRTHQQHQDREQVFFHGRLRQSCFP